MLPSGSNSVVVRPCSHPVKAGQAGFTLMELLVTMVVAVILGVTVHRFYKDSYHTYSMQEQISDRNQNAHFVLSRMVEFFQQAGSALPAKGWNAITISSGIITLGTNPRGEMQYNGIDSPSSPFIALVDASKFKSSGNVRINTTHLLIEYAASGTATLKVAIDAAYNSGGFTGGIKDNVTGMDSVKLVSNVDLSIGDKMYGYREDQIILSNGELILRPNGNSSLDMVMAEGIDSLGIDFLKKDGTATTDWASMKSATIVVRARTEKIDTHLSPPGYHKITLPMNIRFRNKV